MYNKISCDESLSLRKNNFYETITLYYFMYIYLL